LCFYQANTGRALWDGKVNARIASLDVKPESLDAVLFATENGTQLSFFNLLDLEHGNQAKIVQTHDYKSGLNTRVAKFQTGGVRQNKNAFFAASQNVIQMWDVDSQTEVYRSEQSP